MSVFTYVIADDSRSFCRMRRFIQARAVTQNIQARCASLGSFAYFPAKSTGTHNTNKKKTPPKLFSEKFLGGELEGIPFLKKVSTSFSFTKYPSEVPRDGDRYSLRRLRSFGRLCLPRG